MLLTTEPSSVKCYGSEISHSREVLVNPLHRDAEGRRSHRPADARCGDKVTGLSQWMQSFRLGRYVLWVDDRDSCVAV